MSYDMFFIGCSIIIPVFPIKHSHLFVHLLDIATLVVEWLCIAGLTCRVAICVPETKNAVPETSKFYFPFHHL